MRTRLNRIAEIGAVFVKLGVQMGMPTGLNYFDKKKDWLDGVQVIYTSPSCKVSAKATLEDLALFVYKDIKIRVNPDVVEIPLRITDEQLDEMISGLESELEYLKTAEGLLELKEVVDESWAKTKWVV